METPFEAAEALKLVSAFFVKKWPKTKPQEVQLTQVTGGLINRLHLLTRHGEVVDEPGAVLIRHFGTDGDYEQQPFNSSTTLSAVEQALVYTEMGRRGWGPKIYGTFSGGRLEEWIDAHPLTAQESMNASIRRDVARSFARLHSLELPFRKDNFQLVVHEFSQGFHDKRDEAIDFLLGVSSPEARECAIAFRETDWSQELAWTSSLLEEHSCKATFAIADTNYLNILVKNYKSECRVMLIDYETVTHSYRGIDIGGHFSERVYGWSQPTSKLTGYSAPDVEEQRLFCEAYLEEMRDLGQAITPMDTVDHLLLEATIGRMHQLLFVILEGLVLEDTEADPFFLAGLLHMMKTYHQLKDGFMGVHQTDTTGSIKSMKS